MGRRRFIVILVLSYSDIAYIMPSMSFLSLSFSHLSSTGAFVGSFLPIRMATSTRSLKTSHSNKIASFQLLDLFAFYHGCAPKV